MEPARLAPDNPRPLPPHEAAAATLRRAFDGRATVALLDGDPGSGKTTVALQFLRSLPADTPRLFVPAARFHRPTDLLQALLFDLGADYRDRTETELRLLVTDHLLAHPGPTVVVLDEAQHLSDDVLEELRLLGNIPHRSGPAAFVLLVALPGLRARLADPALGAFAQRLAVRHRLGPLAPAEATDFARGRLGRSADEEAVEVLATHTRGSPRLLVQAADLARELAAGPPDAEAAVEALTRLDLFDESKAGPAVLPHPASEPPARRQRKRKSA